jgi:ABC-type sugar transport system permease subunit
MAATKSASPTAPLMGDTGLIDAETRHYLRLVSVWHGLFAVASLIGALYLAVTDVDLPAWVRWLAVGLALIVAVANALVVYDTTRLNHHGRVISLIMNYVVFTLCAAVLLHLLGVFLAIDNLADTFPAGIPYLGIALLGYLIHAFGDRFENSMPRQHRLFMRIGGILAAIGMGLFLLVSILVPLIDHILSDWNTPVIALAGLVLAAAGVMMRWILPARFTPNSNIILIVIGLSIALFIAALLLEFENRLVVAALVGSLITGSLMWMMWRMPTASAFRATIRSSEMVEGLMFLSPNLLGFILFFVGPLLFSLYVSFTDWDAFGTQQWIGLNNYAEIFDLRIAPLQNDTQLFADVMDTTRYAELTRIDFLGQQFVIGARDKLFWISLWNTIVFGLLAVPLSTAPALLIAVILNSKLRGMTFFRAVYFLPSIAAVVGVALIWRWLYNSTVGWLNYFIATAITGINTLAGSPILADPQIGWLSETNVALLAVIIVAAWQWIGFNTVLFLAGLQGIPGDLYEAATVDGAGSWAKFWKITLPMLAPTTFFVLSTRIITAMQLFDQVFVMTNPPGGPGTSTMTVTLHLYRNGFQNFRQGYASAIAWVLFLLILGVTLAQFQRQRGTMAYDG